jgi:hypothetical protein
VTRPGRPGGRWGTPGDYPEGVKEFVVYTLARVGLFIASYLVIAGVWMLVAGTHHVPILWPFLIAAVVSAAASYYLLRGPRQRFAERVDARATAASRRFEEARAREDQD